MDGREVMTQGERIVAYLMEHETISPMDAWNYLGITKLSTRVGEMERNGIQFERVRVSTKNRYGEKVQYMTYKLKKDKCICPTGQMGK